MTDAQNHSDEPKGSEDAVAEELTVEVEAGADAPADAAAAEAAEGDAETAPVDGSVEQELELLKDLQRVQAEFVNYKNRVERDRDVARVNAIAEVIRALLPALDDLTRAEAHGDLDGTPFAAVASKLRAAGDKFGLKSFGAKGDKFDPELHEALLQTPNPEVSENTVGDVVELGYQLGDKLVRPAKVVVFIPAD